MNIFKLCCPSRTINTESNEAVVDIPISNISSTTEVEIQTTHPSSSVQTEGPESVVTPLIVKIKPATPELVCEPDKSEYVSLVDTHLIKSINDELKRIFSTQSSTKETIKLRNVIRNSGCSGSPHQALTHLAHVVVESQDGLLSIDNITKTIKDFLNDCGCESSEDDHDILNHKLESVMCAHLKIDLAYNQIKKFCETKNFSHENFLIKLSDCSEYLFEKSLEEMENFKIDYYTNTRLKNILQFWIPNEVFFRLMNRESQIDSEIIKNNAINHIYESMVKCANENSLELKDLVLMVSNKMIKDLILPVKNTEEIFQIMHVNINDAYLNKLISDNQ